MARKEGQGLMEPFLLEHLGHLWLTELPLRKGLGPGVGPEQEQGQVGQASVLGADSD